MIRCGIDDVINDIIDIVFHLYGLLKPGKKYLLSSVNREILACWFSDRFKNEYRNHPETTVCQIGLYRLASSEPYEVPLDVAKICEDMDYMFKNKYEYYMNISTIIYNNDKYETGLSIYIVPFDCVDYTVYEMCAMIENCSNLSF